MAIATLLQSHDGFSIEFCNMITGQPTRDVERLVALMDTLDIDTLDLRLNEELDDMELLMNHSDILIALRHYRRRQVQALLAGSHPNA